MLYEHWGPRCWGGLLGGEAKLLKLTALQLAHMQEHKLLAICDVPRACSAEEAAAFEAAADGLHYEPGLLPSPVILPNGDTLYPGETTANLAPVYGWQLPSTDSTAVPSTANILQTFNSLCDTTDAVAAPADSSSTIASTGKVVTERYTCDVTGRIWVCDPSHPDGWH